MKKLVKNRKSKRYGVLAVVAVLAVPVVQAGPPALSTNPANHVIFPAKDQTPDQQEADQLAAYEWASKQTGWDPYKAEKELSAQGVSATKAADSTRGRAVGGAARGALLGVAIGAIAGDAEKGAAIGATAGGLTRGMQSNRTRAAAASSVSSAQAAFNKKFALWDRNFVAAMEGKGYTVK